MGCALFAGDHPPAKISGIILLCQLATLSSEGINPIRQEDEPLGYQLGKHRIEKLLIFFPPVQDFFPGWRQPSQWDIFDRTQDMISIFEFHKSSSLVFSVRPNGWIPGVVPGEHHPAHIIWNKSVEDFDVTAQKNYIISSSPDTVKYRLP
jgi:hypothetical protein